GISRIEEGFALALAAAAMALFVAVALAERRQEFATMAALGASLREIAAFLWTETALVLSAALALAALLGWLLAEMLVAMLQHVFDPPPDHLAAPWAFLGGLAAAAVAGGAIAAPVLFLTARDALPDRLSGFDAGGDDYVTKPFAFAEVVARLQALARRAGADGVIEAAGLRLDPVSHAVSCGSGLTLLTPTEFRLLARMLARP